MALEGGGAIYGPPFSGVGLGMAVDASYNARPARWLASWELGMSTDERFGGIARLYGLEGAARLQAAHVAVVGIGGVGSWAAEALARSGVGEISLFDLDDVCITNTNRQVHAIEGAVGRAKVEVMAERIRAINPACVVRGGGLRHPRDHGRVHHPELDAVIDCIDSVAAKAALIAWCKRRKIQIVTTGGAGGQVDRRRSRSPT